MKTNTTISSDDSTTTKKSLISNIANITTNQIGELTTSIQFPINSTSKTTDHLPRIKGDLSAKTTSIILISSTTSFNKSLIQKALTPATSKLLNNTKITTKLTTVSDLLTTTTTINTPISSDDSTTTKRV